MIKFIPIISIILFSASVPLIYADEIAVNGVNGEEISSSSAQTDKSAINAGPPLETQLFKLKYLSPQDIVDAVRDAMGAASGGVMVHQQTSELEITATSEMLEKIKALIAALDHQRNITLEVKAIQVDLNDEHRSGINWAAIVSDYKDFIASDDNRKFSAGTVAQSDFEVLLEALQTVGETKNYPASTMTMANGQESDVRIKAFGKGMAVTMIPVSSPDANPKEHQDRYSARLILSPSASSEDSVDIRIASANGKSTVVHVKKDSLVVVGGIFTRTKLESTKKFPFLGDLPLVGGVFRDQSKQEHLLEDILFLIPHVTTLSDKK